MTDEGVDEPSAPVGIAASVTAPRLKYERPSITAIGSIRDLVADSGFSIVDGFDQAPRGG